MVGVVPTFSLPLKVTALHTQRTAADDLGLPNLYPLRIDMETLALVFTANITSWTDPRMLALNPQLSAWFTRSAAPTALYSVVCCTVDADPRVAGNLLTKHLMRTAAFKASLGRSLSALTGRTIWKALQALHSAPSPMSFVDREPTVPAKLTMQPGSVSYRMISTAVPNAASDFQLLVTNTLGALESVSASPDSIRACVAPYASSPNFISRFIANATARDLTLTPPGCYPLQALASLAVSTSFQSAQQKVTGTVVVRAAGDAAASHQSDCVRAQKNLELLRWIQLSPVLSGALRNSGVFRLSDLPAVRNFIVDTQLNSATCDGKTILITLPLIWAVPSAATAFAIAMAAIVIAACIAAVAGLYKYRHHPMIRSASPIFLAQVAVGLALLAGSLIA